MRDNVGHINNLTGKYIIELSKLKHIQCYMTYFEIAFIPFERQPQINQLKHAFNHSIELVFENM